MNKKNTRTVTGLILRYVVKYDPLLIIAIVCLIAALMVPLFHRLKGPVELDSGHRLVMGTFARIIAVAADSSTANKCIDTGFKQLRNIENLMSAYKDDSEITTVNRNAYEGPVRVSKSTFEVLQKAIQFSKLSDGAFDITVGPLLELWRSAAEANSVPADAELQQARSKVGYELLYLDANEMSIRFAVDGMKLDLGGIAKGYAIDKAAEAMQNCGAIGAMVDVGGDIRCFGVPPGGKAHWLLGLQNPNCESAVRRPPQGVPKRTAENHLRQASCGEPRTTNHEFLLTLKLANAAVATSGDYRRFVLVAGERHSHIIDRKTGTSAAGLSSVTIIAGGAADADALATAVSVMGPEKGLAMIERIPGVEAILVSAGPGFEQFHSSGAEEYIRDESINLQKARR